MIRIVLTRMVVIAVITFLTVSCGNDDEISFDDSLQTYFPLEEGNYWEYTKSYFKSNGDLTTETDVYWNADSCCFYISKIELT
ncbi:MAG: hypothetical protein P8X57_10185, partial [Cyclobacteriaceae bacterium]